MKAPEKYRAREPEYAFGNVPGTNTGFFRIDHYKISNYYFQAKSSDGLGWEHVSVSLIKNISIGKVPRYDYVERCPTWEEMCFIKSLFWNEDEPAFQLHPPKLLWVNNHPWCLHLWRPVGFSMPLPHPLLVGLQTENTKTNETS